MPDMTICVNEKCKFKEECYRYTVKPSAYQSYSAFDCKTKEDKDSEFIDNKSKNK